jgi:hypothetical protein
VQALLGFLSDTANKVFAAAFVFLVGVSVSLWLGWLTDAAALRLSQPAGARTLLLYNRGPRQLEGVQLHVALESADEPVTAELLDDEQQRWPVLRERLLLPGDERWSRPGGTGPWEGARFWFGDLGRLAPLEVPARSFTLPKGSALLLTSSSRVASLSVSAKEFYVTLDELLWAQRMQWSFLGALALLLLFPLGERLRARRRARAAEEEAAASGQLGRFKQQWLQRAHELVLERMAGSSKTRRALAVQALLVRAQQRARSLGRGAPVERLLVQLADELFGRPGGRR